MIDTPTLTKTMQAALFYQPGDVRIEETARPQPGPGEIVIKVAAALTCGTDLKAFRRGHPILLKNLPSPFGHECSGIVSALGSDVTGFKIGDRVVSANSAPCTTCFFCQKNQFNLCENLDLLNGAYAEYLKVPAQIVKLNTLKIPNHVSFEAAAFCEPLSVSMRGIDACNIQAGDRVAILGLGAIGQMLMKLAKLQGAYVVGFGRNPLKRQIAQSFAHADVVVDMMALNTLEPVLQEYTPHGYGFDVVIEAIGLPEMWEKAFQMVRRGGLVNLFGGCESGSQIGLETRRLHYDEITIVSPFHHTPTHFRRALEWIASGQLDPTALITESLPLPQVVEALGLVAEGKAIKVVLKPNA